MISSIDGLESSLTEDDIKEYLEQVIEEIKRLLTIVLVSSRQSRQQWFYTFREFFNESEAMIAAYKEVGIFGSEEPVRQTTKTLVKLSPNMVFPQHGSCIDNSIFSKYVDAIMTNNFAYSGMLVGQKLVMVS